MTTLLKHSKKWIVCIDGTSNRPDQKDTDPVTKEEICTPTNVALTWEYITGEALKNFSDPYGAIARPVYNTNVEAIYFNGVGSTGSKFQENAAGALGSGTFKRVRDAFRYLAQKWSPNDEIYVFGFSRGAYAARSLCGFIELVGLPADEVLVQEEKLCVLFDGYRNGCAEKPEGWQNVTIQFVGLWDTVGSLAFGDYFKNFHRINPDNINYVAHALALDENRELFTPEFWAGKAKKEAAEVWFLGVHCNIGGGYFDPNLSNIAFLWVLGKAQEFGLNFSVPLSNTIAYGRERPIPESLRDSYKEFYDKFPKLFADLIELRYSELDRQTKNGQKVHESVNEFLKVYPSHKHPSTLGYEILDIEPWNL